MTQRFPLFCYTFNRSCPEPDTTIHVEDFIGSPPEITELENMLGQQIIEELNSLGGIKPLPIIRKFKKRPSIECRILNFK